MELFEMYYSKIWQAFIKIADIISMLIWEI